MYKVMIVDDYDIMRRQIKRLPLWGENKDFQIVAEAEEGYEALDKLRKEPVDVLITDIRMPGMNGLELLEWAHAEKLAKFTVFLSDYQDFSFAKKAMKFRLFDYLVKPVQEKELLDLLMKIKVELLKDKEVKLEEMKDEEGLTTILGFDHYLETMTCNLVASFCHGDEKEALYSINLLFNDILHYHEGDYPSANMMVDNLIMSMLKLIEERIPWIVDFFIFPKFRVSFEKPEKRYREKQRQLISFMEKGIEVMDQLVLDYEDGLTKKACLYALSRVEKNLQLGQLAADLYISKNYLGDSFKRETGLTLGQYITKIKMERAKIRLLNSDLKIYEIATDLGYKDAEYFSKAFKKYAGKTPKSFQEG